MLLINHANEVSTLHTHMAMLDHFQQCYNLYTLLYPKLGPE